MKIYTYYTPSHKKFYDEYFSKTILDLELQPFEGSQECETGSYYKDGWKTTTMRKVDVFIEACKLSQGDVFVYSDVDIQFFGPLKEQLLLELGDADIAIQNDYKGGLCSGFFVCRGNEKTLRMFQSMKDNESQYLEDQHALNMNLHHCSVKVLSPKFWTFGMYGTQWKGQNFDVPDGILMHHANWTEGLDNKTNLLNIVKSKVEKKNLVKSNLDDYQNFLNNYFSEFRPEPKYPVYPPYHKGKYLEDYFYEFFNNFEKRKDVYFIPVSWTTCYIENVNLQLLQEKLLSLDGSKQYFTVSQHDDAIKEHLPPNTKKFSAGGNAPGIPIPLICSEIPNAEKMREAEKDIFCSFVGSITHPIRKMMVDNLEKENGFKFIYRNWSNTVSESDMNNFFDITSRSIFTLCPRGYGKNSFRMYESLQLGSIPIYIYDEDWRPFRDLVNWDEFSISIHYSQIPNLPNILRSKTESELKQMQEKVIQIYNQFSLEEVSKTIIDLI